MLRGNVDANPHLLKKAPLISMRCSYPNCQAYAVRGDHDQRCVFHSTDPVTRAKMDQARTRGGQNSQVMRRKPIKPPQTVEELSSLMAVVLADSLANRISQSQAEVAAKLAGVILKSKEMTDLEKRIAAIEAKSGKQELQRAD